MEKQEAGTVTVEVLHAKDLPRADKKSSDPFIELKCNGQTHKTSTKKKNLNPEWGEIFVFNFNSWDECDAAEIEVKCWDWDLIGSNDLMGVGGIAACSRIENVGVSKERKIKLKNRTVGKDKDK